MNSRVFQFFFLKSIFSSLLIMLLIVGGIIAYSSMIKESYPDLEIPQALVVTFWPGASPEEVEKEVTIKIEQKIKSLKGLKRYRSGSTHSMSTVAVEFTADSSMTEAMQLLRAKISESESEFPKGVKKPYIEMIAVSDDPIMTMVLTGENFEIGVKKLKDRLIKIPGIKKVDVSGDRGDVVNIMLRPERIHTLGLSPVYVKEKIREASLDMSWGSFENTQFKASIKLSGRYESLTVLGDLPIGRYDQGRVVRLRDIALISRGQEQEKTRTYISRNGQEYKKSITLDIFKIPGKDTVELVDLASEEVAHAKMSNEWPMGMEYTVVADESQLISDNLKSIFTNCWQAVLAVFVILLFMLTWREAIIAGIGIPITFSGSLFVLWMLGHTMNEMVIIGMILALGLLVDDFILVVEGMHEALYLKGMDFIQAVNYTVKSYALPSFSGSITTILVMLPLMTIGGLDGKFIRIIPITASICLTMSYIVSIFIAIPLSRFILKKESIQKTRVDILNDKITTSLQEWLKVNIVLTKLRAGFVCTGAFIIFIISMVGATELPSQLYPKEDGRNIGITIELSPDASLTESQEVADLVGDVLKNKKYLQSITKYVGRKSPYSLSSIGEMLSENQSSNFIGFSALFIPKDDRNQLAFEYVPELRKDIEAVLKNVPGVTLSITPQVGGSTSEDPIQLELTGHDMDTLKDLAEEVKRELSKIAGVTDVRDNLGSLKTTVHMTPNMEALDFYHISQSDLAMQVRLSMTNDEIGKFRLPGVDDDLNIHFGMAWPSRDNQFGGPTTWEEFASIHVVNEKGKQIPLSVLVKPQVHQAYQSILHKNGKRTLTIMAKTNGRTVQEILSDFHSRLEELKSTWPSNYEIFTAGETEASSETYNSSFKAFIIGLLLIFSILALLFDSFKQPLIILVSVPFALIGVFSGFFLFWIPFSFPAMIGVIALVGIVVNDLIIMIECMNNHVKKGRSVRDAAVLGMTERFRPIISTTLTTTVGLIPLGLSSPAWMPLCAAIIFGEVVGTLIAIMVVPALFLLLTPEGQVKNVISDEPEPC